MDYLPKLLKMKLLSNFLRLPMKPTSLFQNSAFRSRFTAGWCGLALFLLSATVSSATWGYSSCDSWGSSSSYSSGYGYSSGNSWGYGSDDYCRNGGGNDWSNCNSSSKYSSGYHQKHTKSCYDKYDKSYYKNSCNDTWYYKSDRDHCWYSYDDWKNCWDYECDEGDFECDDDEDTCELYRDVCLVDKGDGKFYDECGDKWYYFSDRYDCWYVYKNGCWSYFSGSDLFDECVGSSNEAPTADPKSGVTELNTPITFTLSGSDPDGDAITFALASAPDRGSVSISGDQATYTPNSGYIGSDSFTYVSNDGSLDSAPAQVTITILQPNRPPLATDLSYELVTNESTEIVLDGSDPDGDSLTFTVLTDPSHGVLVDLGGGVFQYTPDTGFNGADSFTYKSSDGFLMSAVATVTITIACDESSTGEGVFWTYNPSSINGTVIGSIRHLTGNGFNLNSGALITGDIYTPGTPTVRFNGNPTFGEVVEGDGSSWPYGYWIHINNGSEMGNLVIRTDGESLPQVTAPSSPTGWQNWTINSPSAPRPASADFWKVRNLNINSNGGNVDVPPGAYGNFVANNNTSFTLGVVGATEPAVYSFENFQWNSKSRINVVGPVIIRTRNQVQANGPAGNEAHPEWMVWEIYSGGFVANSKAEPIYAHIYAPNGRVTVDNKATICGATFSKDLTVNSGGTLSYCAAPVDCGNEPPVAEDLEAVTLHDLALDIPLEGSDPEGATITYTIVGAPANGTVSLAGGVATYTPGAGFVGVDTFTYLVNDGELDSELAIVTITVTNGAPVAYDDAGETPKNTPIDFTLTGADPDGDTITYAVDDLPSNGVLSVVGNAVTYTPTAGFAGTDTFTFHVSDSLSSSNTATITITVVNAPPVALDESATTPKNTPVDVTLEGSDPDGDAITFALATSAANGTVSLVGEVVTYTPNAGFSGSDSFTYTTNDGSVDSAPATVSITVTNVLPVVVDLSGTTPKNTPIDFTVSGSDADGDALTYALASSPSNGSASIFGTLVTYTPATGFAGTDSFTYVANDGVGNSVPGTIEVTVINGLPIAEDVSATTTRGVSVNLALVASDIDGDSLTYTLVSGVSNGSLSLNGSVVTYSPDANFAGMDTFTYKVSDGLGDSNIATGTVTVSNTPPTAVSKSLVTPYQTAIQVVLSGIDADGDAIVFSIVNAPSHGVLSTITGDVTTYTPNSGFSGIDTFTYRSNDGLENSQVATVTITVESGNLPPMVSNLDASTPKDTPVDISLVGTDPDGDVITYFITAQPTHGSVSLVNGIVTYTPNGGYLGYDSFRYVAFDGSAQSSPATVTINVYSVGNEPPVTQNISVTTAVNTPIYITLLGSDPNGDPLTYQITSASSGQVSQPSPGLAFYTPANNFTGVATFRYRVFDGSAVSNISTVTVTITDPTNAPPVVNAGPDVTYLLADLLDVGGNALINLDGSVSDDGLPSVNSLTSNWTLVSRPGTGSLAFGSPSSPDTGVTIGTPAEGYYTFRLTASDTIYTVSDEVVVRIKLQNEPPVALTELRMYVDAVDVPVMINGVVTDDGLPFGAPLTSAWEYIDGPGSVIFDDPSQPITSAIFTAPGIYLLQLSADDTEYTDYDVLTVYVNVDCIIDVPTTAIAWWTGNRSFVDYVERRHDALPDGDLVFTDGVVSLGFLFDGQSGFRSVATTVSNVGMTASGGFSLEGWFSPDVLASMPLVSWADTTSSGVSLSTGASGELVVTLPIQGGATIQRSYPNVFAANTFRHVAVTYNASSGILRVYVDGAQIGSGEAIGVFNFVTTQDIWVGKKPGANPTYYRGVIDELTLYRGTVLTASEIFDIFRSGYVGKCGNPDNI